VKASQQITKHKTLADEYSFSLESEQRKSRYLLQEKENLQRQLTTFAGDLEEASVSLISFTSMCTSTSTRAGMFPDQQPQVAQAQQQVQILQRKRSAEWAGEHDPV
jgi:hypothetical protein